MPWICISKKATHTIGSLSFYIINYAILLTATVRREIFLDAFFLWNTPLLAALSISVIAAFNASVAAALSLAAIAASTFLIAVFTVDLIA